MAIADENPWALSDDEAESSTVLVAHGPTIADFSAANPSAAYAEFNKSQRAKVVKFCRSGPRDRLLVLAISLMLSISVLRVVEHVGSDAFQVKAWRKCSSGEYSSRIVAMWQGILQNTADEEMRRLQQCDAWRAIRPAGRTVGLCTLAQPCLQCCMWHGAAPAGPPSGLSLCSVGPAASSIIGAG